MIPEEWSMPSLRTILEIIGALILAFLLWENHQKPVSAPANEIIEAMDAPEVKNVPKASIAPPRVIVYSSEAKKTVALPEQVKADPVLSVLNSVKVPDSNHAQTVTSVINSQTGETKSYVVTDPYPWVAAENKMQVSMGYGISNGGRQVGRISFADDLVQVKAIHLGVSTTLDSDGQYFAGIMATYRF